MGSVDVADLEGRRCCGVAEVGSEEKLLLNRGPW